MAHGRGHDLPEAGVARPLDFAQDRARDVIGILNDHGMSPFAAAWGRVARAMPARRCPYLIRAPRADQRPASLATAPLLGARSMQDAPQGPDGPDFGGLPVICITTEP